MVFFSCGKEDEDDLLADMDRWTRKVVETFPPSILSGDAITDEDLEQPQDVGTHPLTVTRIGATRFENLSRDPSFGRVTVGGWVKLAVLHNPLFFPLRDVIVDISDEDVPKILAETQLDMVIPKPNVTFENPQSDKGMTRQAFYGLGAHRLEAVENNKDAAPDGAVYMVDLMSMADLPVRRGFEQYGACAYFDGNQKVIGIEIPNTGMTTPGQTKWEHAKFAWRSSLFTIVTAVDHLFHHHFWVSAQMLRASTVALPASHAIRRALQPFLMRTALVNNLAGEALLPRESMVHHDTSLTWGALKTLAAATYRTGPEWTPLPDLVKNKGSVIQKLVQDGKLPIWQDGLELYDCFVTYWDKVLSDMENVVKDADFCEFWSLLRTYTESKELPKSPTRNIVVATLANFSYRVTSGHEHVGSVSEHIETPLHGGFRYRPNSTRIDKQSFLGTGTLLALTSIRTPPLMSNFKSFWISENEKQHWQALQDKLEILANRVEERNQHRPFQVVTANPRVLECAVSV